MKPALLSGGSIEPAFPVVRQLPVVNPTVVMALLTETSVF